MYTINIYKFVTGPCEFLVMYDIFNLLGTIVQVTGPCEFLVMYDALDWSSIMYSVTGPCEFLVMYDWRYKHSIYV